MKRTSDVTILGTVVCGVSISTTTFTLRSRTSLGSTQINNQSKASKRYRYWVMTSEKRSPTYVVYHFDTQRLSPTRVCKKRKLPQEPGLWVTTCVEVIICLRLPIDHSLWTCWCMVLWSVWMRIAAHCLNFSTQYTGNHTQYTCMIT